MIKERKRSNTSGFTLFELSISIVIIGLITGAIVVGNELIKQATLRKQITQLNAIEAGIQNFRIKYACYPGDCADPTVINGYTYAGNGNGYLETTWNDNENKGFWLHLSLSKMIDYPLASHALLAGMKTPVMIANPQGVINAYGNIAYIQNALELDTTSSVANGALKFQQIKYIDKKIDDGVAASGNVRSTGYGTGATTVYTAAPTFPFSTSNKNGSDQCINGGVYSGTATHDECNMLYILGAN